jgi:hypothetical protein
MNRLVSLLLCVQLAAATSTERPPADSFAINLLQSTESMALQIRGLDRAYALWLLAEDYAKVDVKAERRLVKASCEAAITSQSEANDLGLRNKIQFDCLRRILILDPKTGKELLARAEPDIRQQITAAAAAEQAGKGDIEKVLQLLSAETSNGASYPYRQAIDAMRALPPEDRTDRDRIFAQALNRFATQANRRGVSSPDLGTVVTLFWKDLSPQLVIQGIESLLDAAREEGAGESHLEISISSARRDASFGSLYEYRLSQVYPALRELDPIRARTLEETHGAAVNVVQQLTEDAGGVQKFEGWDSMSLHLKGGPATSATSGDDFARITVEREAEKILSSAKQNPDTALTNALLLPNGIDADVSTKADLLINIAQSSKRTHPDISQRALQAATDMAMNFPPLAQARYLVQTADLYLEMKEVGQAEKIVRTGLKPLAILYKEDADSDDPNYALKSSWPSTVVSRALVAVGARISTKFAESLIQDVPDPDLQVFDRIELAGALLKAPPTPALMQRIHKDRTKASASVFPIPIPNGGHE